MLYFHPQTGLYADTTSSVREEVRRAWASAFAEPGLPELDTAPETPAGQLIDSQAAAIARKDAELLYLANQFNPYINEGKWQDALARIYFLKRKVAEPTIVECRCTGLPGTVIPGWSLVKTPGNVTLVSTASAVIEENGTADVIFRASKTGPLLIGPHEVNQIVTTITGWDTVDNPLAGVVGRDEEGRAEFEQRRRASVAANAHGSAASMHGAVNGIKGVLHCKVLENTGPGPEEKWGVTVGGHSVLVSVYGGDDHAIAEAIYRKKDAGCGTSGNTTISHAPGEERGAVYEYRIQRPEPAAFGVQVTLRRTPSTPATVEQNIRDAVLADFNGQDGVSVTGQERKAIRSRVSLAETAYASRFTTAIVNAGVPDLVSVKVAYPVDETGWRDEADIRADTVPVLSEADIRIVIQE